MTSSNQLPHLLEKGQPRWPLAPQHIDPTTYLDELLAQASSDLMRQMLQSFINQILSTQADQICGAWYATTSKSPHQRP